MTKEQLQWAMYEAYATQLLNRIEAQEAEIATLRKQADGALCVGETLAKERDGLLTQVQDMRAERERLRSENQIMRNDAEDGYAEAIKVLGDPIALSKERAALRAEVAALQERLRASIARGDFAQMEVAALMSQTPKHPVKVGEWVKRLNPIVLGSGTIAKVLSINENDRPPTYTVEHIDGNEEFWFISNCEPCDPPEATHAEPDLTQLHAKGKEAWSDVPNATQWVEEMRGNTEATHDTEAGKAAAQNAEKTEQVADEIKVGDLVEVVSNRGRNTWLVDVGSFGTVTSVEEINESISVHLDDEPGKKNALAGYVSFCDVRKVTT